MVGTDDLVSIQWTDAAVRVLQERYLLKDSSTGEIIESPNEMLWRVADAVSDAEAKHCVCDKHERFEPCVHEQAKAHYRAQFYHIMSSHRFLPNSPTLMNAGSGNGHQLAACFVLPLGDSLPEIYDTLKAQAIVHASGGGTGISLSRLRPKGSLVRRTQGVSSGPISFLRVFDASTAQITQGGRRRGANLACMRVDHPDILEFIKCKLDGGITNFNISVGITDAFMKALMAGHGESDGYNIIDPQTGKVLYRQSAKVVWEEILAAAWSTGDPGLLFLDRANHSRANPTPDMCTIETSNPCGEQLLSDWESCNLGSINLAKYYSGDAHSTVLWDSLEQDIRTATRFLDDVVDINPLPMKELLDANLGSRRIGLGIMGWADLLFLARIPYDSDEAIGLGSLVMQFISSVSQDESERIAEEKGPFPNWPKSIYKDGKPIRNSTRTTVAPTGTISILAGCSSGCEPIFALSFSHQVRLPDGTVRMLVFHNEHFEQAIRTVWHNDESVVQRILMDVAKQHGSCQQVDGVPEELRLVFKGAHEISPDWHVRMQAAFQSGVDNSISKTVNLPNSATTADVDRAYRMAWDLGCMGITVFRDGSKDAQVLNTGTEKKDAVPPPQASSQPQVRRRPRRLTGSSYRQDTPLGRAYISVNRMDDNDPMEVFINIGKAGNETAAIAEGYGRLLSLLLRMRDHISPEERLRLAGEELQHIGGDRHLGFGPGRVSSFPDAIAKVLLEDASGDSSASAELPAAHNEENGRPFFASLCPSCQSASMIMEEGCKKCYACGFSEC